ncbi:MAG: sugar-binding protein, partial [bacterium]|nr:sugar-binding protein [bacterium]
IMGAVDPEEEEENTPVYTDSADGGVQKHFSNIFGNQLWSYSPRHYCQLISYDRLQRKSALRVKKISREDEEPITSFDDFNLVEVFTYGESQPEAQQNNLRGQIKELKDLSGIVTNSAYSMQESVLETSRQMAEDYKTPLNWNKTPIMEEDIYNSKFTYNALSMALTQTTPDDSLTTNTYNQSGQLDTVHVRFKDNSEQQVVKHIEYDAKGQRETIEYGNGIITSYMYEPTTLRLTGLLSTKSNGNGNKTVQDIDYTFDPVGNVTRSWDHTFITVFNNNQKVDPLSDYTYDALYRLVKANGRQHPGITADTFKNNI